MATLLNSISSLSEAEKYDLLDAIWEDIESHASRLTAEQAGEIDRRVEAYEKDPSDVMTWEQVKAGLPKR